MMGSADYLRVGTSREAPHKEANQRAFREARTISEDAKREAEREQCDAWRLAMKPLLDRYKQALAESTDLGNLYVWAKSVIAFLEVCNTMKLLLQALGELRVAFGHDSKTVIHKPVGSDFEKRLAEALDKHQQLEASRVKAMPVSDNVRVLNA